MIWIRTFFICIWLAISCMIGVLLSIVLFGNPNVDFIFGQIFSKPTLWLAGIKIKVFGREHLGANQPCIYVANHQGAMDLATFGAVYAPRTIVIGKKEVKWIPFFGLFFFAAGNIMIDRKNRTKAVAGLAEAVRATREQRKNIWIFPEGTRNSTGAGLLPFKRGAFHMAVSAGVPVVPVLSSSLTGLVDWKTKKMRGGEVQIRVLPPISTVGMTASDVNRLMDLTREQMLEALRGLSTRLN